MLRTTAAFAAALALSGCGPALVAGYAVNTTLPARGSLVDQAVRTKVAKREEIASVTQGRSADTRCVTLKTGQRIILDYNRWEPSGSWAWFEEDYGRRMTDAQWAGKCA